MTNSAFTVKSVRSLNVDRNAANLAADYIRNNWHFDITDEEYVMMKPIIVNVIVGDYDNSVLGADMRRYARTNRAKEDMTYKFAGLYCGVKDEVSRFYEDVRDEISELREDVGYEKNRKEFLESIVDTLPSEKCLQYEELEILIEDLEVAICDAEDEDQERKIHSRIKRLRSILEESV